MKNHSVRRNFNTTLQLSSQLVNKKNEEERLDKAEIGKMKSKQGFRVPTMPSGGYEQVMIDQIAQKVFS